MDFIDVYKLDWVLCLLTFNMTVKTLYLVYFSFYVLPKMEESQIHYRT